MSENITIRDYRAEDLGFMLNRHKNLYRDEYGYNDVFYGYAEKTILDFMSRTEHKGENIWIAEDAGVPVGMIAVVGVSETECQLRWFLVDKPYRKCGVGGRLMDRALVFAESCGYSHIFLLTASNLESALRFYAQYGFCETMREEVTDWADKPLFEIRLDKDIEA